MSVHQILWYQTACHGRILDGHQNSRPKTALAVGPRHPSPICHSHASIEYISCQANQEASPRASRPPPNRVGAWLARARTFWSIVASARLRRPLRNTPTTFVLQYTTDVRLKSQWPLGLLQWPCRGESCAEHAKVREKPSVCVPHRTLTDKLSHTPTSSTRCLEQDISFFFYFPLF